MSQLREDYLVSLRELNQVIGVTPQGLHHIIKNGGIDTLVRKNKKLLSPENVRKLFLDKGYDYPKEVISFSVVKGGVGKTSISHSFAIRASQYGAKVLVVDLDQQANLTQAFGIDVDDLPTMYEIVAGETSIEDSIIELTSNLHMIPSSMNMSFLDRFLQIRQENLATVFADRLEKLMSDDGNIGGYDFIVLDCPPAISSVTAAATLASDRVVMPVTPMKFSLKGLQASFEELDDLSSKFKKKTIEKSILFNRYDARKASSPEYLKTLMSTPEYSDHLVRCFIRENSEIENCINEKSSVFDSYRKNNAREDLDLFVREIMGLRAESFGKQ
jgi:chromosome partitioning protein